MAIILTFPTTAPTGSSLLLGSIHDSDTGTSATKNFSVSSLVAYTMANGFKGLDTYANNAAALAGGLTEGEIYKTLTGVLMVVYI